MGGTHAETPFSYCLQGDDGTDIALLVGGDLRKIEVVRKFWKLSVEVLTDSPSVIWLNLSAVLQADTKLAACIVAILRRAQDHDTIVYIVGSNAVQDVLKLCKVPPLYQFTKVA